MNPLDCGNNLSLVIKLLVIYVVISLFIIRNDCFNTVGNYVAMIINLKELDLLNIFTSLNVCCDILFVGECCFCC